jgi:uncharacterized membrane protein YgcG
MWYTVCMPTVRQARRSSAKKGKRSFAARHGAAIAAGCSALVLLLILAALVPREPFFGKPPPPRHWFDDQAGLVSTSFASAKSTYLQSYVLQVLRLAVLVVIEREVPPAGIEEYTTDKVSSWKIGAKGGDNGVVLFVFPSVRTARLQVGYGLEGAIPDIDAKHLLEATLLPKFSAGRYEEGFDDFLAALVTRLQEHPADSVKADSLIGIVAYAMEIVRQLPRLAEEGARLFKGAEPEGRAILAVFAAAFASMFAYGFTGVGVGLSALVQLPWRVRNGQAWRAIDRKTLAAEFAPAQFVKRPPRSIIALWEELHCAELLTGVLSIGGIIVGIAFLGLGAEVVMEGHGTFSGAGVTAQWPASATR